MLCILRNACGNVTTMIRAALHSPAEHTELARSPAAIPVLHTRSTSTYSSLLFIDRPMMHTYLCPYAAYTLVPTLLQGPCSFRSQQSEQLQPAQIEAGPSDCPYDCTTARLYYCKIVLLYDCTAVRLSRDNRSWWRLQSRNKRIRNWQL